MIKEDFEDKQNFIYINEDYLFISIDYIYLFLSQKIKNFNNFKSNICNSTNQQ